MLVGFVRSEEIITCERGIKIYKLSDYKKRGSLRWECKLYRILMRNGRCKSAVSNEDLRQGFDLTICIWFGWGILCNHWHQDITGEKHFQLCNHNSIFVISIWVDYSRRPASGHSAIVATRILVGENTSNSVITMQRIWPRFDVQPVITM